MSEQKQIEEMAWKLCDIPKHPSIKSCEQCGNKGCHAKYYAKRAIDNGYRKASDVAEEIFAEIEAEIDAALTSNYNFIQQYELLDALWSRVNGKIDALRGIDGFLAELKKKYGGQGMSRYIDAFVIRLKEKLYTIPTVYNAHFSKMVDAVVAEMKGEGE